MTFLAALLPPGAAAPKTHPPDDLPSSERAGIVPKRRAAKMLDAELSRPVKDWCDRPIRVNGAYRVIDHLRSCGRCATCRARKAARR